MHRPLLLALVALPVLAACSAGTSGGSGGSGGGGAGGGGAGSVATGTDPMDAGVIPDAPSDAPSDAAPDAPSDAAACTLAKPYSSQDADCNACAEASCCAEVNACLLDPECDDGYVNCAIACALEASDAGTDPACLADCAQQYPKGAMEYDAAIGCVDGACAAPCQ